MNTNKPFDPDKPVQSRSGMKAKILMKDGNFSNGESILAVFTTPSGKQLSRYLYKDGNYYSNGNPCDMDLINIPEKHTIERYFYIYNDGSMRVCENTSWHSACVIAIKKLTIEYTEGEGLE